MLTETRQGAPEKRLVRAKMGALVLRVETEDKMTERQLARKVRGFFAAD